MSSLPYVTAPGNIEKAFLGIKAAAVPDRVSQDFVKTILQIKGGSGNQMTSFLKKIGFVNADGTPSELYKRFRNSAFTGEAAAEATKIGFAPLYVRNEYMHKLTDEELRGLITEETGHGNDSSLISLISAAIKSMKKFANFATPQKTDEETASTISFPTPPQRVEHKSQASSDRDGLGLNLSYTINLNLPATSDIAVFNAIFKSLRENLLGYEN